MAEIAVVGIDLGTRKSGVCFVNGSQVVELRSVATSQLVPLLTDLETKWQSPCSVVVDTPIDPTATAGYRRVDRVFMSGLFNNNSVGLQPNNPDLLNMGSELQELKKWCFDRDILYSNEFPCLADKALRETMPNPALGMLVAPADFIQLKHQLRFRYGRGKNIAPIVVAFECCKSEIALFSPLSGISTNWCELERVPKAAKREQSDDLISAMVCASLAWWDANSDEASFVRDERGHYILPPKRMIHPKWASELERILDYKHFRSIETNLR